MRFDPGGMMRSISTIEVALLARELSALKGYHLEQFYQSGKGLFRFKLASKGVTVNLLAILPLVLYESTYLPRQEEASNFAMAVRKRVDGMVVAGVEQYNEDRIILIHLSGRERGAKVIIELFGKGNLLLLNDDMVIDLAYVEREFRSRSIRKGERYLPPQNSAVRISNVASAPEIIKGLLEGPEGEAKGGAAAFLAKNINIGVAYVEDAMVGAGIVPKSPPSSIGEEALGALSARAADFVSAIENPEVTLYMEGGRPLDYSIKKLAKYSASECVHPGSLQAALDSFYRLALEPPQPAAGTAKVAELERSIERQRALITEDEREMGHEAEMGRKVFENMEAINSICLSLRENRRMGLEELRAAFPWLKIVSLDLKDKSFTIDL